jgi:hypothetical protein
MKDSNKTREQLMDELVEMHKRVAEFETLESERNRVVKTLNIKIWIDGENKRIEGTIPITTGVIATTQLLPHLSLAHPLCP